MKCRMSLHVLAAILLWIILAQVASTEELEWSFLEHPALSEAELRTSFDEAAAIAGATTPRQEACRVYEERAWNDYLERYPAFRPLADRPDMREGWLSSAIRNDLMGTCYVRNLTDTVRQSPEELDAAGPIRFCGNLSREPRNLRETRAVEAWLMLLFLARPYSSEIVGTLVEHEDYYGAVRLDHRLRHYFLTLQQLAGNPGTRGMEPPGWHESRQLLRPEERGLVESAARRGDLAAVLNILPPCGGSEPGEVPVPGSH